jgi:Ca2+-binding EF-hand superfamily protein
VQGNPAAATAQQPVTGAQVAQVVDAEFPGYDKNGDNLLSTSEFGAWMVALKTQSDPTTVAAAPETRKWVDGAFAQADADKNKMLTKTELTRFLTQAG